MKYRSGFVLTQQDPSCFTALRRQSLTQRRPEWARRMKGESVWVPPTSYTAVFDRYEVGYGWQRWDHPSGWDKTGFWNLDPFTELVTQNMLAVAGEKAMKAALVKLKNQDVNFAQFFGETNQTVNLLKSTSSRLAKFALAAKKGNIKGALRELGTLGSNRQVKQAARKVQKKVNVHRNTAIAAGEVWSQSKQTSNIVIESRFGWQPLLDDLYGTAKKLADRTTSDPTRTRFYVKGKWKQTLDDKRQTTNNGSYRSYTTVKGEYGAVCRIDYYFTNAALASASSDGLTNPSTLWEIAPWTFAADWCTGLGDWLSALDATLGKGFVGGTVTLYEDFSRNRNSVFNNAVGYYGYWKATHKRKSVQRGVLQSFPDATMFALNITNPLKNARRITTSLALLRQAFS